MQSEQVIQLASLLRDPPPGKFPHLWLHWLKLINYFNQVLLYMICWLQLLCLLYHSWLRHFLVTGICPTNSIAGVNCQLFKFMLLMNFVGVYNSGECLISLFYIFLLSQQSNFHPRNRNKEVWSGFYNLSLDSNSPTIPVSFKDNQHIEAARSILAHIEDVPGVLSLVPYFCFTNIME